MKIVNSDYLINTYGYDLLINPPNECEFIWTVTINHSYDPKTRIRYIWNVIESNFCEWKYKIKITIKAEESITVSILDPGIYLRKWPDFHIYDDWTCCICSPQDIIKILNANKGPDIKEFYENYVVPFFYNQTYYSIHNEWLLWEYSHGDTGVIERYAREDNPDKDFTNITLRCLSDSMKTYLFNKKQKLKIQWPLSEYEYWCRLLLKNIHLIK